MRYHLSKLNIYATLSFTVLMLNAPGAFAGSNDFFGQTLPNGQTIQETDGKSLTPDAGAQLGAPPGGDYTDDEKRMQKKYRSSIARARSLIAKGERMMKDKDQKTCKKGKVLKDIGEKQLAELKANNPFADELVKDKPKGKSDTHKAEL